MRTNNHAVHAYVEHTIAMLKASTCLKQATLTLPQAATSVGESYFDSQTRMSVSHSEAA